MNERFYYSDYVLIVYQSVIFQILSLYGLHVYNIYWMNGVVSAFHNIALLAYFYVLG